MSDDEDQRRLRLQISDELEAVMRKHDVGGAIFLTSRESASWRFVLPQWSGLQFDATVPGGLRLRMTSKTPDEHARAESTLHMIACVRDMCNESANLFGRIFRQAKHALEAQGSRVDHTPFNGTRGIDPKGRRLS